MKKAKATTGAVVSVLLVVAAVVLLVRHFHIRDFYVIEPEVLYTSGQPSGMDYSRLLYRYHIGTIVNVRSVSEDRERNWLNEELNWTRNNAVPYIELPIEKRPYFPDRQTQDRFLDIMANKNNFPVLLHGSGDDRRVAMLTAAWLRRAKGYSVEDTLRQVRKIIDDQQLSEDDIDFVRSLQ